MEHKNHRWINDDVVIDFPIPKSLLPIIEELEKADANEDWGYFDWSEVLDCDAKEYARVGKLTIKQWDTLCEKYDGRKK